MDDIIFKTKVWQFNFTMRTIFAILLLKCPNCLHCKIEFLIGFMLSFSVYVPNSSDDFVGYSSISIGFTAFFFHKEF